MKYQNKLPARSQRHSLLAPLLAIAFCVLMRSASAQTLYDGARDATAKKAADAAGKIATGDLWDKMLRNLDKLSAEDINAFLLDQQVAMRAAVDNMRTWSQVDKDVADAGQTLAEPSFLTAAQSDSQKKKIQEQEAELNSRIAAATKAIDELKKDKSSVPDFLQPIFDNLGDVDSAVQELKGIAGSGTAGTIADRLTDGVSVLKQIQSVFTTADQGLKNVATIRAQLGGFDVDVQQTLLLRLQADEEHLKNRVAIIARRTQEEKELSRILLDYQARRKRITPAASGLVTDSLMEAAARKPEEVFDQAQALYDAVTLVTRGQTPAGLQALRIAEEEERYSIRASAAEARAYEQLLNSGAQRLALFYSGGIKPETVAQLLFNALSLANLGYLTFAK